MEMIKLNTMANKIFLGIFVLLILFSVSVSAKRVKFQISTVVPAARGYVKITQDKNRNYEIGIKLTDMAEVSRLEPSKLLYIVWMVTEEGVTKNMGKIDSSTGFLSSKLKASFETVTSFNPIHIFITAEDDPSLQYPGNQLIISTGKF